MPKNKVYSTQIKEKARQLRKRGWSLGEINQKLNIPKNTLSGWVKEIKLTKKQKRRIKQKEITSAAQGRILAAKLSIQKLTLWKNTIRKRVAHFGKIPFENQEIGKLICGMIYLCEGAKYPSTRCLTFSNTDPKMIQFFLTILRSYFKIDEKKFRCRIQYRYDQNPEKLMKFWSWLTKIPLKQFYKAYSDKRTKNKPTTKKGYKGVCGLQYFDTSLQFELQSIGEAVINYNLKINMEPTGIVNNLRRCVGVIPKG
ncbi:MAG: hypothetical protein Q8O30_10885 [Candidatus Omnitrophota bacterium]|nr:hypothetical protein [Candidatus Omnitrophota bacterium]